MQIIALLLIAATTLTAPRAAQRGRVVIATVHSQSLELNLLRDPSEQRIGIYLPPSYEESGTRQYPVLYLLHGFGGSGAGWFEKPEPGSPSGSPLLQRLLDDWMASADATEMIVVTPNGANARGGSFYVNSAVNGNWDDFIARDVVSYVDSHYRTIAFRKARGIAGISMGGFGALVVGGRHADVFGAIYAMSPCCTSMAEDFSARNPAWKTLLHAEAESRAPTADELKDFYVDALWALASALSPDAQRPGLLANLPYRLDGDHVVRNDPVFAQWEQSMPPTLLATHADDLRDSTGIAIEYGLQDEFPHIPAGARALSVALASRAVPHTLEAFTGMHMNLLQERLRTHVLPYFGRFFRGSAP